MKLLTLDIETYYDRGFSLRKLTIPEYVHDPRYHTHGMAVRHVDGRTHFHTDVAAAVHELQEQFGEHLDQVTVVCHNAMFDLYVLNHLYGLRPRHFIDTMLLAYHVHGRPGKGGGGSASLRSLAERYGLPQKGDLDFMCGVRRPTPEQQADLSAYAVRDVEITHELALQLLPKITRPEVEFSILMHTVRLFTERGVRVDARGVEELREEIRHETDKQLAEAGVTAEDVSKDGSFRKMLQEALSHTGRDMPMKKGTRGPIPATAKTDPAMQALMEDSDPKVASLARARIAKKGEAQKQARLDTLDSISRATGGVLPPSLIYYGAHTGRFSGGGKFNLQNLGRSGLGGRIRNLLVPEPGHVFVIGDLAQIEARIIAGYACQDDMLCSFSEGRDIYSEFATEVFGTEVRKPRGDDPAPLRERLGSLRQVGKQAVLGLGFGMGPLKFMKNLQADPKISPLFTSGQLSPLICREIVNNYRARYAGIPRWWKWLESGFRTAISGAEMALGPLRLTRDGDDVLVWLPSGRALRYADARMVSSARTIRHLNSFGQESEFGIGGPEIVYGKDNSLYGGKLAENVVQATARDILVEAILGLEEAGIPVLFHVHDEVVVQVPREQAEAVRGLVEQKLTTGPAWATGLPLAAEVNVGERYGK